MMALRAERDALAEENERLREALREFAIVPFRELSDQCVLCGKTWDGDESHAPGCLVSKGEV